MSIPAQIAQLQADAEILDRVSAILREQGHLEDSDLPAYYAKVFRDKAIRLGELDGFVPLQVQQEECVARAQASE